MTDREPVQLAFGAGAVLFAIVPLLLVIFGMAELWCLPFAALAAMSGWMVWES